MEASIVPLLGYIVVVRVLLRLAGLSGEAILGMATVNVVKGDEFLTQSFYDLQFRYGALCQIILEAFMAIHVIT